MDTKTDESKPEQETVYFFDGLAKAPSLIKRAAEEIETLMGKENGEGEKSADVVVLAKEGLDTIMEAIHVRSSEHEQKIETTAAGKKVESVEHEKTSEEAGATSHEDKPNDHIDEAKEEIRAIPKELPMLTKEEQADLWKHLAEFFSKCCSPSDEKKD